MAHGYLDLGEFQPLVEVVLTEGPPAVPELELLSDGLLDLAPEPPDVLSDMNEWSPPMAKNRASLLTL